MSGYPAAAAPCSATDPKTVTPNASASPAGNQAFEEKTLTFTGAAGDHTTITFTATSTGCAGPVIDDVVVTPTA